MRQSDRLVVSAIEAFQRGEIIIVTDDADRENEADLFVAASKCTADQMAFFIRHTSGIICAPLDVKRAEELKLAPMVADNVAPLGTAFTVSIDLKDGFRTGISAEERTRTVRQMADEAAISADFIRPGHVFPLIAREGGVLIRSGHTEACVDICQLAGLPKIGVLSELMNDDGTVMRGADVTRFAEKHALQIISIADLIAYRQSREKLVERVSIFQVDSEIGRLIGHAYLTPFDRVYHFAFIYGDVDGDQTVPVRLHRGSIISDVFARPNSIDVALKAFEEEGRGVLIYLRDGVAGVPVDRFSEENRPLDSFRIKKWRDIGLGAQILADLNVRSVRLLSSSQHDYVGIEGFGIEIVSTTTLN